jgi:hypothetical protein
MNATGLILSDSANYIYSGDHRSQFDFNSFEYVELQALETGTSTDFLSIEPKPNNVDSASLPRVAFDTLNRYTLDFTGGLTLRNTELAVYNADTSVGELTNLRFAAGSGSIDTAFRQTMTYNSAGQLSQVFSMQLNGSNWDTAVIRTILYNSGGNVALDSLWIVSSIPGAMPSTQQTYYTYNGAGQYTSRFRIFFNSTSGSIDTSDRMNVAYYPGGQLHTNTYEFNYGNGLQLELKDSFGYTAGVPGFTSLHETAYDLDSSVLFRLAMTTSSTNAQNLKDSMTVNFDSADVVSIKVLYNANGNPVSAGLYDLTMGSPALMEFRRWHYPAASTGIIPGKALAGGIRIYPNPTTGTVTLDYPGAKAGTALSVRVTNMSGQLVHARALILQGSRQQMQLGSELAPGEYFITIRDVEGHVLCNHAIVKQ